MLKHPDLPELASADDAELQDSLGSAVVGRETIHAWPLSWVQRLVLADGRRLVYKAQLPPTVEAGFYAAASCDLLADHQLLGRVGNCATMVIDWIDAPLLRDAGTTEADLITHTRKVIAEIGRLTGDVPVYLDLGTPESWLSVTEPTLGKLRALILDGRFGSLDVDAVDRVRTWSTARQVVERITEDARVVHADLHDDQIFLTGDGYRVIDWQRPIIGPPELDLASTLIDKGIDPLTQVTPEIVGAFWFHRLHWAVTAQFDLFPGAAWPLFDHWAAEAVGHLVRAA